MSMSASWSNSYNPWYGANRGLPPGRDNQGANTWAQQQMLSQFGPQALATMQGQAPQQYQAYMDQYLRAYQPPSQGSGQQYAQGPQGYQGGPQSYQGGGMGNDPYAWMRNWQQTNPRPSTPQFGQWGGGGQQFTPWGGGGQQFTPWGGPQVTAPGAWQAPQTDIPEAGVDTRARVESMRHYLDEQMGGQMGDAARQMAAGGLGLESSDYVGKLGESQRSRDRDLGALYYQYDAEAAQADANRRSAAREAMLNRDLGAWQTQGGWDMGAQQGNQAAAMNAWQAQNAWNQNANQMDFGAWQGQNAWNQQANQNDFGAWQAQNQWAQQDYQNQLNQWLQQFQMAGMGQP